MLEQQNKFLSRRLDERDVEIKHMKEIIALLSSPQSGYGQTASMVVALERISDSVAHVLGDLEKHEQWRDKWLTDTTKRLDASIQTNEMLSARSTIVNSRTPRTKAKGGVTKKKTKS
jgi:hypothetical protein